MRLLANRENDGELLFTVFRLPGMSDEQYEDDIAMELNDLAGLKHVLEDKEKT